MVEAEDKAIPLQSVLEAERLEIDEIRKLRAKEDPDFLRSAKRGLKEAFDTTRASFYFSNVFSTDIQTKLNLPRGVQSFFISRRELQGNNPNEFQTRFPNNFGYFVVSHAGLNLSKTEAILYVDHFCGGLCGGGGYFLMQKINGVWRVVDEHVTWVS
jgi:hypothetical protein